MIKTSKRVSKSDTHFYNLIDALLIIFIVGLTLIFILWPVLAVIKKSFFPKSNFSLELYRDLLFNNKKLIYNSIFVAALSTLFSTLISIGVAIYISFSNKKMKYILTLILMLTMISPPFVSSLAYIQLFGKRGFITYHILNLSINPYGWHGVVMMQSVSLASLSSLILISTIKGIDKSLLKASLDLGSTPSYAINKVLIPLMKPGIIVCALLSFIKCLSDFGTPMTIGGSFNVLATEVYMQIIGYANFSKAAAINILILIPALFFFIIYRIYIKNSNIISKSNLKLSSDDIDFKIKGFSGKLLCLVSFLFLTFMVVQYITIFISCFAKYTNGKIGFTLDNFKGLEFYGASSFVRSIIYSLIAGIIGSLLGLLIAYFTEKRNIRGMKVLDFISTLPYIIPGTFFGIGYILAFNHKPLLLIGTATIVVLNCTFKQLPMTTKTSSAALAQINSEIEDAAKDLGAKKIYIIKDIIIPNMKPAFLVSFINNFTTTMTTIGSIIFLISPGKDVATVKLFDSLNTGSYGLACVISSIIILITLTVNLIFSKLILGGISEKNVSWIK